MISIRNLENSFSQPELPEGWVSVPLKKLCIQDRKIIQPGYYANTNLPYLSMEHIESHTGRILRNPSDLIEDEGKISSFTKR